MAEREGFEPSVQLPVRILRKDVPSAARPSLQRYNVDLLRSNPRIVFIRGVAGPSQSF